MSVGYKVCLTLYYSPFVIFSEVPLYLFFFILHVNSLNLCHCQTWWLRLCRGQWASAQVKQNQKWKTKLAVFYICCLLDATKEWRYFHIRSFAVPPIQSLLPSLQIESVCSSNIFICGWTICRLSPESRSVKTFSRSPESRCDNIFARIFSQIIKSLSLHSSSLNYWELARSTFCQCLSQISS